MTNTRPTGLTKSHMHLTRRSLDSGKQQSSSPSPSP